MKRFLPPDSPEQLRRLYHDDGMTVAELAEHFGCSSTTVLNWMKMWGIDRRCAGGKEDFRGTIRERLDKSTEIDPVTRCWNWNGALSDGTYGSIYHKGRMRKTHVVSWELENGPVPEGLDLDHLCRNTKCRNPNHLEPVTRSVNLQRRVDVPKPNSLLTHCPRGHEYKGENLIVRKGGWRSCRTCMRQHIRNWRARKKLESSNER